MASVLGANIYSDIFAVAFKLPNLFRRIFGEGAFAQSFMPSFIAARYKSIFAVKVLLWLLGIILVLTLFVNLLPQLVTKLIAPGFSATQIALSAKYVAIQFWYLPLIFIVTFLGALLQYREHFATTAFATVLLNIALIVAMLLYKDEPKEVILLALSWGVLVGGLLQVIVHLIVAYRFRMLRLLVVGFKSLKKKKDIVEYDTKRFFKNFLPAIWGNSTAQVMAFLDTWLASFLVAGSISYLYYANRVFQLPLALFAIALSVAIFPSVAKKIKANDIRGALLEFRRGFWILLYLLSAATVGAILFSQEIIWLLFERGAFTRQNTIEVAWVLQMYMVGLIPYGLSKLFNLWLFSKHLQNKAAKNATIALIVYALFAFIFIKPLGAMGLALAGSLSGFVGLILSLKYFGFGQFLALLNRQKVFKFARNMVVFTAFLITIKVLWIHI